MRYSRSILIFVGLLLLWPTLLFAQKEKIIYVPKYSAPVFKEIRENARKIQAEQDSITAEIRARQKKQSDEARKNARELRFDFSKVVKPSSPESFKQVFHNPPLGQYRTGTCWSFSGTSFVESEIARLTEQKVKLSEMFTVYHEYLEKVRHFVRERGDYELGEGSESNAVLRMIKLYGCVPEEVYDGRNEAKYHDHSIMVDEITAYLALVNTNNYWDEDEVVNCVKVILNKYLGEPPQTFQYNGKTVTPIQFATEILKINPDDYVSLMSTLEVPFYTQALFDVPDNWWKDSTYYNVPLDEWYAILKSAITKGYSMEIGGDMSEPGDNGAEDAAIIPDFDIPQAYINQDSRELRINNGTTGDEHGIHIVGITKAGGHDWFLIKDSARSRNQGKFEGYLFFRDDYIRLKMLSFMVHKDAIKDILKKFNKSS